MSATGLSTLSSKRMANRSKRWRRMTRTWIRWSQAIEKKDQKWFQANLNSPTLAGYKANAVWIYDPEATLGLFDEYRRHRHLRRFPSRGAKSFGQLFAKGAVSSIFLSRSRTTSWRFAAPRFMAPRTLNARHPDSGFFFVGRLVESADARGKCRSFGHQAQPRPSRATRAP